MKIFLLILISFLLISTDTQSKEEVPEKVKLKLKESFQNANALGKYFVIAIPPNDLPNNSLQILAIFVAASEQANVTISTPEGLIGKYIVPEMGVKPITTENDLNWSMMLNNDDEDEVTSKGIIIESDKPVSIYVLSSKGFTSEGYLAIPVSAWGFEYIHCSFYDFDEVRQWKTGLTVVAAEDRTRVTLELKGRGEGYTTLSGRTLNSTVTKNLDRGETYYISGTGQNRGGFDLTGTIIRGNKPLAIISSHERCMIPATVVTSGRDNLLAMPPPVRTWGKNYVSIELDRATDKGDFFRVVAGEDNVTFEVRWYEKKTGVYLGIWDGILAKKGDFAEYHPAAAAAPHNIESIRGISYFKSDKPIFVMQYSYSAYWDRTPKGNYDPFMFPVSLVEQFTKATIFQTPSNTGSTNNDYLDNYLNLIILADAETEEERIELIKTLKMDGKQLSAAHPEVYGQKFPPLGTKYDNKLYWLVTEPTVGPHSLEGDVSFGGYIYGFANFDSYGWPAATAYRNLGDLDTLPPVLEIIEDCGYFEIRATEFRTYEIPQGCDTCLQQIDRGIIDMPYIVESENFTEPVINYAKEEDKSPNENWTGYPVDYDFNFIFEVVDKKNDAFVQFLLFDATNENYVDTTLYYYTDKLSLDDEVNFGLKRLYSTNKFKVNLVSDKDDETIINEIKFKNMSGNYYTVTEPTGTMTIAPKGQIELTIQYVPTREYLDAETYADGQYDLDSLIIETECVEFAFPVKGQGGEPYMYISDWDNGTVPIKTVLESNPGTVQNLYIQNYNRGANRQATFPLEVYGIVISYVSDETGALANLIPYSTKQGAALDANDMFVTPYVLPHTNGNARVSFNRAEFNSPNTGLFERNVPFRSNAVNYLMPGGDVSDDTTSKWKTRVVSSAVNITNELWLKEREQRTANNAIKATINGGKIIISNSSTINDPNNNITLKSISLNSATIGDDRFISPEGNFEINLNTETPFIRNLRDGTGNVELVPQGASGNSQFEIPILFTPQDRYDASSHVITESLFATVLSNGEESELEGTLTGEVYLPIINANGDESTDAVLINTIAPYTLQVTIQNVGYNGDLYVWDVTDPDNNEFTYEPASAIDNTGAAVNLPTDANPWMIPVGETYTLFYNFTPNQVGTRIANVNITHSGDITGVEPVEDGVNTRQTATAVLQAPGRSTGFESTPLSLGPILKCVDDTGIIEVANNGTDPITITAITLDDGTDLSNASEFEFTYNEGNNISTFVGVQIPANSTDEIEVRFIPSNLPMGVFTTTRNILISGSYNQNENPTTTSVVTGDALENFVKFNVNDNNNPRDLDPSLAVTDGNFNLGISVDLQTENNVNGWEEAKINEIEFKFRYKLNWLHPTFDPNGNYILKTGPAANGWNFEVIERELDQLDNEWEILTIKGVGPNISNDGVILYPYFNVKLPGLNSDSTKLEDIRPELYDITFGERDFCIFNEGDTGLINVQACAAIVRTIPILTGQFVNNITQTASSLELDYAVPFESDARIEVIDMNGNVVSIPVKEKKGMGFYKASIPLSELATGAHIVRYTAGPLSKIDKVIIVK